MKKAYSYSEGFEYRAGGLVICSSAKKLSEEESAKLDREIQRIMNKYKVYHIQYSLSPFDLDKNIL